jgi:hypothetical protein
MIRLAYPIQDESLTGNPPSATDIHRTLHLLQLSHQFLPSSRPRSLQCHELWYDNLVATAGTGPIIDILHSEWGYIVNLSFAIFSALSTQHRVRDSTHRPYTCIIYQ